MRSVERLERVGTREAARQWKDEMRQCSDGMISDFRSAVGGLIPLLHLRNPLSRETFAFVGKNARQMIHFGRRHSQPRTMRECWGNGKH